MKICVFSDYTSLSAACADGIETLIKEKPDAVLGLATGASPEGAYEELIRRSRAGELSFRAVKTFNLDEYCGLPRADRNSYYSFMWEHLFGHIDIAPENARIPDGNAPDLAAECLAYDEAIKEAGGIDLQVLGIGRNGHIGFNEPADAFTKGTHVTRLTKSTIDANKRYFDDNPMPEAAITMGIGTIFSAKRIVLLATGKKKAEAIKNTVQGDISPRQCPASILQLHPDVTLLLDEEAASLLG
ncbi:MAG: glucosamine-6-phosphate deaminase [Clostridia bacterium]|nr:glucosamine-6-phosphate deaminase [Clostridia bacterium]